MSKFGYKINKSTTINLENADLSVAKELLEREPSFAVCMSCGSCTATCSAGNFTDYNLRKMQLLIKRGEIEEVAKVANKCMLCGKCQMLCPRGLSTRNIVLQINKLTHGRKI